MLNIQELEYLFLKGRLSSLLIECSLEDSRYLELVVSSSNLHKINKIKILGMIKTCFDNILENPTQKLVVSK